MSITGSFKEKFSSEERRKLYLSLILKKPGCVPCVVEAANKHDILLEKSKFLVTKTLHLSVFSLSIRGSSPDALWFLVGNTPLSGSSTLGDIWSAHHDDDGFLYLTYRKESAFG